jgi:hypothetical protein
MRALPSPTRRRSIAVSLLLLLAISILGAAEPARLNSPAAVPTINVPANAPVYTLVTASTEAEGKGFAWFVLGSSGEFVDWRSVSGNASEIVFTGKPGKYTIMLVVAQADGALSQAHAVVVIGANPDPEPDPNPPPPPPPEPGKRFVLVIAESKRTAEQAEALHELRTYALSQDHQCSIRDPDEVDRNNQPIGWLESYKARVKAAGVALPAIVVIEGRDGGGSILAIKPLPSSGADAIQILKATGG